MCLVAHSRLPMDRTTRRLLHSRFAGCPRPLGGIRDIGTRLSGAQSSLRQLLVLKNEAVALKLTRSS